MKKTLKPSVLQLSRNKNPLFRENKGESTMAFETMYLNRQKGDIIPIKNVFFNENMKAQ